MQANLNDTSTPRSNQSNRSPPKSTSFYWNLRH